MGIGFSMGDNEYMSQAERARQNAKGGGLKNLLQGIGQALGLSEPVAKAPKGDPSETGDLASQPETQTAKITDDKGDVISAIEVASAPTGISRLPMAPMTVSPPLIEIDPDTGLPLVRVPGSRANNNFGMIP
jgi:hypothetical protein